MSELNDIRKYIREMPALEREACAELAAHIKHLVAQAGARVGVVAVALVHAELTTAVDLARSMRSTPECGE